MNPEQIKKEWNSRGYSYGIVKDPQGQIWEDFVHNIDELVVLSEEEIEIEVKSQQILIGKKVLIPAKVKHTVRNFGKTINVWHYRFKKYNFKL